MLKPESNMKNDCSEDFSELHHKPDSELVQNYNKCVRKMKLIDKWRSMTDIKRAAHYKPSYMEKLSTGKNMNNFKLLSADAVRLEGSASSDCYEIHCKLLAESYQMNNEITKEDVHEFYANNWESSKNTVQELLGYPDDFELGSYFLAVYAYEQDKWYRTVVSVGVSEICLDFVDSGKSLSYLRNSDNSELFEFVILVPELMVKPCCVQTMTYRVVLQKCPENGRKRQKN